MTLCFKVILPMYEKYIGDFYFTEKHGKIKIVATENMHYLINKYEGKKLWHLFQELQLDSAGLKALISEVLYR